MKTVTLSTSAFVGKIFAYSFFYLPDVSKALLFLLTVKQHTVETVSKQIFSTNNQKNTYLCMREALQATFKIYPPPVHHIVGYNGKTSVSRSEKRFINSMIAPNAPVKGIQDPKGLWVKRWASFDSDVFCSFLRHYLHIVADLMVDNADETTNINALPINALAALPGFLIILSHFYELISEAALQRIKKSSILRDKDFNISFFNPPLDSSKNNKSIDPVTQLPLNVTKILKTLRDFFHNSYDENEALIAPFIVHLFDQTLQSYASKISAYDSDYTGYILDIAYEFIVNIVKRNRESDFSLLLVINIDWNFWVTALQNMLQTSNINCELKLYSILFNLWELLPNFSFIYRYKAEPKWFTNHQESIKWNLTAWLLSIPVFNKYFCHWQPLVRSYYQRLICWRLIACNKSDVLEQDESIRRVITNRLNSVFDHMNEMILESRLQNTKIPEMSPSTPMANRKIVINRILQSNEFFISDNVKSNEVLTITPDSSSTRKIHAYEIFDDAIYCSNSIVNPKSSDLKLSNNPDNKATSFMDSAFKFFKRTSMSLTESDISQQTTLSPPPPITAQQAPAKSASSSRISSMLVPPSGISKTFSSLSLSSRSSSPSLMSNVSNSNSPQSSSVSDLSELESLDFKNESEDYSDKEDYENVNPPLPPELDRRAPEISRSIYMFQLVFNESGIQKQLQVIKDPKFVKSSFEEVDVPSTVKVPDLGSLLHKAGGQYYLESETEESETEELQDEQDFIYVRPKLKKFEISNTSLDMVGRSINEWNLVVDELESFVENHVANGGDIASFDKIIPFLSVEYPNKTLNAY